MATNRKGGCKAQGVHRYGASSSKRAGWITSCHLRNGMASLFAFCTTGKRLVAGVAAYPKTPNRCDIPHPSEGYCPPKQASIRRLHALDLLPRPAAQPRVQRLAGTGKRPGSTQSGLTLAPMAIPQHSTTQNGALTSKPSAPTPKEIRRRTIYVPWRRVGRVFCFTKGGPEKDLGAPSTTCATQGSCGCGPRNQD